MFQGSCADDTASTRSSARADDELPVRWIDEEPPSSASGSRWPAGRRARRARTAAVRADLAAPHVATVTSAAAAAGPGAGAGADLPPVEAGTERRLAGRAGAPRARSSELLLVHGRPPPPHLHSEQPHRKSLPCLLTAPLVD